MDTGRTGIQNPQGDTLLHLAIDQGQCERVRDLLVAGENPNVLNKRGFSPLDRLVSSSLRPLVIEPKALVATATVLLEYGANPNVGVGALSLAANGGHIDVVRLLVKAGALVNGGPRTETRAVGAVETLPLMEPPLFSASHYYKEDTSLAIIALLLANGADPLMLFSLEAGTAEKHKINAIDYAKSVQRPEAAEMMLAWSEARQLALLIKQQYGLGNADSLMKKDQASLAPEPVKKRPKIL